MIKISEEMLPIPSKRAIRYPMRELAVGQHFDITGAEAFGVGSSLHSLARHYGIKITQRKIEGGYRVWRVA